MLLFLGHLRYIDDSSKKRYIEDKLFVRNIRNKFYQHMTLFIKYLVYIIIEYKMQYVSLKKKITKFKILLNNKYK